jgi:hydrogenase maturation factor
MPHFRTGKIPSEILVHNVFPYKGKVDRSVILGSSIGEDAALISHAGEVLVLTTDPVTGASSDIGWLSVHVNANDIACRGATPKWFLCDILLPEKASVVALDSIMKQIDRAAKEVRVSVVGGHTEVTPGLERPIVVGYMMGFAERGRFVTSSGARPGNDIIMTKTVGIEGTAVLAGDFYRILQPRIGGRALSRAKRMRRLISVVEDARLAVRSGGVRAMHDPTEGGLLQGVWELAQASKVGFTIHQSQIRIRPETEQVCAAFQLDPLRLMSSGCLLLAVDKRATKSVLRRLLRGGISANVIGKVTDRRKGRKLVKLGGDIQEIGPSERDEIYRVIESYQAGLRA